MKPSKKSSPDKTEASLDTFPFKLAVTCASLWVGAVILCLLTKFLAPAGSIYAVLFLPFLLVTWLMTPFGIVALVLLVLRKYKPSVFQKPER